MPHVLFFHSPDDDGNQQLRAVVTGPPELADVELELVREFCRERGGCVMVLPEHYTVEVG